MMRALQVYTHVPGAAACVRAFPLNWAAGGNGPRKADLAMERMEVLGTALLLIGMLAAVSEMHSLTFYLLVVAIAAFAGAAAAFLGLGLPGTLVLMTVVMLLGLPLAHYSRRWVANHASDAVTHDDIGNEVVVLAVNAEALRVDYRGTGWQAQLQDPAAALPAAGQRLRIVARRGNLLILE